MTYEISGRTGTGEMFVAEPIAIDFDVTDALPAEAIDGAKVTISGWAFLPGKTAHPAKPVAIVLIAGGSYDKRYHHVQVPGRDGYSAAEHLAALGNVVLLTDHLGVGQSSRLPDQKKATRQIVALANHAAVAQFRQKLAEGTLHPSLPVMADVTVIGGGHSMGGMQTVIQQARHRSYDGIMVIGYTADGVHFTMNGKKLRAADFIPTDSPDYTTNDRAPLHEGFHWEDVPEDVIAADDALAVETPANIGIDSIRTGIMRPEAAEIDVPVYICLGERDVSPDPHAEPAFYRKSPDVTVQILPRSGHCQSFASTRHAMWDRMHNWSQGVATSRP